MKNWGIGVNSCWYSGPSKLLLHFIEYHLDQFNKHTKIAVYSTLQYFEGCYQKKCLLSTKSRPCKIFTKLNGNYLLMSNIFKLHEYQTFGLINMHNMSKIWFVTNKLNLLRWNKKHFSCFSKGFQLPEIVSDLRMCL